VDPDKVPRDQKLISYHCVETHDMIETTKTKDPSVIKTKVSDHFSAISKMIKTAKTEQREIPGFHLSRYARCIQPATGNREIPD
jgi:hypothetical protein